MDKNEFITILKQNLTSELPEAELATNLKFYNDYISSNGEDKTEQDRLDELGDPRLIARTITDTYKMSKNPILGNFSEYSRANYKESLYESDAQQEENNRTKGWNINFSSTHMPWYQKLIMLLIVVLIGIVVLTVSGIILNIFLKIGIPILLILLLVSTITKKLK